MTVAIKQSQPEKYWDRLFAPSSCLAVITVGGIGSAEHAYEAIRLGASLVQVLTALIYSGPGLVRDIKRGLVGCWSATGSAPSPRRSGPTTGRGSG